MKTASPQSRSHWGATLVATSLLVFSSCVESLAVDISTLLSKFKSERNIAAKEATLSKVIRTGSGAGQQLFELASTTEDPDTRWLAIRGLGQLRYKQSAPFLLRCLSDKNIYVRSNSARALGELGEHSAVPALIELFKGEPDGGVIEQTALAFEMLKATDAIPALKKRINYPSGQTRGWILGAISVLGSRADVPFFAAYLYDKDASVGGTAARAIEQFTGQNFGLPKGEGYGGKPIAANGSEFIRIRHYLYM